MINGKKVKLLKIKPLRHKINQLIDATDTCFYFPYFQGIDLISNNPMILSLFKPPNGKLINGLVLTIVEFLRSRVPNVRAFDELTSSHCHRLRHPSAFISKFFIFYSSQPHTAKSCLAHFLSLIYGHQLSMCSAKVENIEDQFNSWQSNMLTVHIEELQNENYQNHHFETTVKQLTTKESSSRAMHCEAQQSVNQAIWGCNSNKSDFYGLIRSDEATINRLVILHFKPKPLELHWIRRLRNY
jgi:hypothetical protein